MGNLISCGLGHAPSKLVVKLVHSNGLVEEFYRPVRVGELTPDYPHHFICHSNDLSSNMRSDLAPPSALSDEDEMELGQIYFLLPKQVLASPLTQADIAALFSKAALPRKASYKGILVAPLPDMQDVDITHVTISPDFFKRLLAETRLQVPTTVSGPFLSSNRLYCGTSTPDLDVASTSHILAKICTRAWRPLLDTIEEGSFLS